MEKHTTKTLLTSFFLLFTSQVFCQIVFSTGAFEEALRNASKEGKQVFVQLEAADCEQCNDVANKGFEDQRLAEKLTASFVCLKISNKHPDRDLFVKRYQLSPKSFGSFFIDNNGSLLHSFRQTTTSPAELLKQVDLASTRSGEMMQLGLLEKEYQNGNRSFGFLELLLEKKKAMNQPTDHLLDQYVAALPVDSLKTTRTLSFIAGMSPSLGSLASKTLYADAAVFSKVWTAMPFQNRVRINNQIIAKSMAKAITEKNESAALQVATFARNSNNEPQARDKAFDMNMLRFYDETGDTSYFSEAVAYYDRYFMSLSPDSIKRNDSVNLQRMMAGAKKETIAGSGSFRMASQVRYAPIVQYYSGELNTGAAKFYQRTQNQQLLAVATSWSKRALEFYESVEALDTYAKLLYKQKNKEEAIRQLTKAIALQKKRGFPTTTLDATLNLMNQNKPLAN